MFRRTKQTPATTSATVESPADKQGGKGRPTPTRKEAEAAARARAKGTMDKKAAQKVLRDSQRTNTQKMREAMKTGDERYLPARDKGPVRRFIRDYVDSRICVAEFMLPLLLAIMFLSYSGNAGLSKVGSGLWTATLLITLVDTVWLHFRLRKQLRRRFPNESTRGTVFYMILRVMQLRFMRMPKPQVKLGQKLPEHYR